MSTSMDKETYLKVSGISCDGLPLVGRIKRVGSFYVVVTIDDQFRWTDTGKQSYGTTKWDDELYFDTTMMDEGHMTIQVWARRTMGEDSLVGEFSGPVDVSSLLTIDSSKQIQESLFKTDKDGQNHEIGQPIRMTIVRTNFSNASPDSPTERAKKAILGMHEPEKTTKLAGALLSGATTGIKKVQGTYNVWKSLLQNVETFVRIMDSASQIDPYARMAWSVLSLPLKAIVAQTKRDKKIQGLLETMNDIYSLVLKAGPLRLIKTHQGTIQSMCQQTAECAFFISGYASRSFSGRMIKSSTTDFSSQVNGYQQKFQQLKDSFLREAAIGVEIAVYQIATNVKDILSELKDEYATRRFDEMRYARNPFKPERCLVGTRKSIIRNIIRWFSRPIDNGESRVYWLSGVAGCGKSAVARSIADQLAAQSRCVSFFFHASRKVDDGPNQLFASISRYLTGLNDNWKASLFKMLKKSPSSRDSATIEDQFESLLLGPAKMTENIGPMLIVIDALDESGDTIKERERVLGVLSRLTELPPQFRFLITSRPESDIHHLLGNKSWVYRSELTEASRAETDLDIGLYVRDRLETIPTLDRANFDRWIEAIVARSKGLFQWAATACKYIKGEGLIGDSPTDRVNKVLDSPSFNPNELDNLYTIILNRLSNFEPGDDICKRFQTIMGFVLALRKPLSMDALIGLLSGEEEEGRIKAILTPLGSLLTGVSGGGEPIQPLHLSFADFLTDKSRSGKYWIDMKGQDEKLMHALFRVTQSSLRFNICKLSTSYQSNDDVDDLQKRIAENIPAHLDYACCYWMDHLKHLPVSDEWLNHVDTLMRSYLLFWFEALSIMRKFGLALSQLADLRSWLSPLGDSNQLRLFADDAHRFGTAFGHVIRHSAPHLYLSALPFIPRSSLVSKTYLPKYPGCLNVVDIDRVTWPQTFLSISVGSPVNSVAFSPDGKTVVSGSSDGTVRIWSADTGELVAGPFRGHSHSVQSVAFSPDGTRVVSGSYDGTVRIWNVDSGALVAEPFEGHTGRAYSVSFSPDGQRVVSGSFDNTVRIWDARTGKLVAGPFQGHTGSVLSVGFSRDGNRVISGSADNTVRIWDATTGELIAGPFQGHTDWVRSALFLPDDERVISCSDDKTIRIWNVHSKETIVGPFQCHTDYVMSMALSLDGKYIVSGSQDRTVRVWDIDTGELVDGPFQGHTSSVYSVGFSLDGKQVVSGSQDGTVRVWRVNIAGVSLDNGPPVASNIENEMAVVASTAVGVPLANGFRSHTDTVTSAEFSPDGHRVVTGSSDGTVRVWSALTGEPIAGPFRSDISSNIIQVGFSPDGKQVISGLVDGKIVAWSIDTGDVIDSKLPQRLNISGISIAFSSDFHRAVSGSHKGEVEIWDTSTGKLVVRLPRSQNHTYWTLSLPFSPDGKRVASGSDDNTVKVWNADTGRLEAGPLKGHISWVFAVGFSPDGKQIISGSGDKTIRVWSAETGALVGGPFQGHQDSIRSLRFLPDGKRVVSGSNDRTVRVWDASTGELVAGPFQGHSAPVWLVASSPNGNQVISSSEDGVVCMWLISHTLDSIASSGLSTNDSNFKFFTKSPSTCGLRYYNGWMRSNEDPEKLLFWTPEDFYPDISPPYRTFVIARNPLRLDVSTFSHGDTWAQCYRP